MSASPSYTVQDGLTGSEDAVALKEASHEPTIELSACPTLEEQTNKELTSESPMVPPRTRDFGLIPIPESRRYHPERAFHFTLSLNIFFGFASTAGESLDSAWRCRGYWLIPEHNLCSRRKFILLSTSIRCVNISDVDVLCWI